MTDETTSSIAHRSARPPRGLARTLHCDARIQSLLQCLLRPRAAKALALCNGRGGASVEEFGSVTRRFPWSVIAIEALSPMIIIHTRRIIIVPSNQPLLGFLAPPFESHCRFGSHIYQLVSHGRKAVAGGQAIRPGFIFANGKSQHFDLGQKPLNLCSPSCRSGAAAPRDGAL